MKISISAKTTRFFAFFIIMMLSCTIIQAQTRVISGIVTDNQRQPLAGVNVYVKGKQSAITDASGKYVLNVDDVQAIVVFSFIGFVAQEIAAADKTTLNVTLEEDAKALEQVVVVGYGTQSRRDITGSVATIDMSKNSNLPSINVAQALSGVSGVVFKSTGRPGQGGSILIRGQNSLSGATNPLIVVDGITFNGNLSDINQQDIETMAILKDASAASIYGSRAANGVILITSKQGASEKPRVTFNTFNGFSEAVSHVKNLTPERFIQRLLDWRDQSAMEADPAKITSYLSKVEADNYLSGTTVEPWKEISQQSRISSYDLSISAKTGTANYYLSGSFSDDHGLIYNDNEKRVTLRTKIDNRLTSWLNVGINASLAHRDPSGIEANVSDAYRSVPYGTWYYPDGAPTQYIVPSEQSSANAMRDALLTTNDETSNNLFSNFYAQVDVPFFKGQLSYRLNYSPNYRWDHDYTSFPQDRYVAVNTTKASKINQNAFDWVLENIVTYKRTIGKSDLNLTLLYGTNHSESEITTANASLFDLDVLNFNNLGLGNLLTNSSSAIASKGVSSMARLNYQFNQKYTLTLTARRDGSSVFSANNKYATFPSAALAWMVSDEPFLKKLRFIDMMKFRVSYGSVGNQGIAPYQSLSLSATQRYVFGDGGASSLGVVTSTMGNDDLKWETTYTSNAALDFDLFIGRLGGTVEVYNSNTYDLLVRRTIPIMSGYRNILTNIGQTNNKGIELTLNTVNIRNNTFQWASTLTFSHNKNEIIHLFRNDLNGDGREDDDISNSWFIGKPINSFYNYAFDGIYQEGDKDIPAAFKPGYVRFKDLVADKVINAQDRTIVATGGNPDYQFSIRNNFRYKKLSLSVLVYAMEGWKAAFNELNPHVPGRSINQYDSGWWTKENRSNDYPSLVYPNPLSASWYLSRDFVRIKDASLTYDFQKLELGKVKLSNLRVYLSAMNLYTFTKWPGADPENASDGNFFPMPRTVSLGLNAAF